MRSPWLCIHGAHARLFGASGGELLATVDVERRAGERRVAHDVYGERGDVRGPDDPADRERRPQLVPTLLELIAQQRCRQRCVDEAGGDEVDANRRDLEGEGRDEGRQRGGGGGDDAETVIDAPARGA